ncbi:tetratricopeptide repeat protein [Vibrio hippocampi]|uniref:J domain-containing protein n=1 Tax=Vibrio hippocampi TaxID=654686 RepID=A0ABM8ZIS3_9VIBR|nr:tetratricopeptide repeat protein [Vibrio hippocampi]CAH0525823.1 hypothetical protein VHP8226_01352 [Vibrio hippocampi]
MYRHLTRINLSGLLVLTASWSCIAAPSVAQLEQLAASNDPQAQYQLGLAYETGEGVNKNLVEATKWYRIASDNGHQAARFNYAQALELGTGTKRNPSKAALLYTQLAVTGQNAAFAKLGNLYSQFDIEIPLEDQAVLWYHLASEDSPQYQDAYNQALQRQYNARQKRQVDALQQKEQQTLSAPLEVIDATPIKSNAPFPWLHLMYLLLIGILSALFITREFRRRQRTSASEQSTQQLRQQIELQQQKIKQLTKHIKIISERYQNVANDQPTSPDAQLQLAYARFGFDFADRQNLTIRHLKQRYKKLSRVYHPDAQGSEEEMKQLNLALDVILNRIKQNRKA